MANDTMQKSVRRYENVRDSGIEWIGAVPSDWSIYTLGQLAIQVKNKNLQLQENNLLSLSYGKIKRKNIETKEGLLPASFDNYNIIDAGDIVLRLTDLQNDHTSLRVGLATEKGIITSAYVTLRPKNLALPAFMYYVLHAFDIRKGFYGMGAGVRQGLKFEEVRQIKLCVPSPDVQQDIVDYLNQKCALIESFIIDAKTSIEEYKAWKSSIIYEAVTKGLNPNVEMKESGVEYLGKIVSSWDITRLKFLLSTPLQYGANEAGLTYDKQLPRYIRITDISLDGQLKTEGMQSVSEEVAQKYLLDEGDILLARSGATAGKSFYYKREYGRSAFAGYLIRAKINPDKALPKYIYYTTLGAGYDMWRSSTLIQSTIQNISAARYNEYVIALPSIPEQRKIVSFLDKICSSIDDLIAEKNALIAELESYKKSLIFEAVTGKRKVV